MILYIFKWSFLYILILAFIPSQYPARRHSLFRRAYCHAATGSGKRQLPACPSSNTGCPFSDRLDTDSVILFSLHKKSGIPPVLFANYNKFLRRKRLCDFHIQSARNSLADWILSTAHALFSFVPVLSPLLLHRPTRAITLHLVIWLPPSSKNLIANPFYGTGYV